MVFAIILKDKSKSMIYIVMQTNAIGQTNENRSKLAVNCPTAV